MAKIDLVVSIKPDCCCEKQAQNHDLRSEDLDHLRCGGIWLDRDKDHEQRCHDRYRCQPAGRLEPFLGAQVLRRATSLRHSAHLPTSSKSPPLMVQLKLVIVVS